MNNIFDVMPTMTSVMGSMNDYVTYFIGILDALLVMFWFNGWLGPKFVVYAADFLALNIQLFSSAYVVVKTINSSVSFTDGFASVWGGASTLGQLLGLWELAFVLLYLAWSLFVTTASYLLAITVFNET